MSTQVGVLKKLSIAREKFHSLELKKTGQNKFAGYMYFELGDFLIPALKAFREAGLSEVISYGTDVATMTITDLDDGSEVKITSPMAEANLKGAHQIQNLGAVQTYTRRYLWVTAMEIVEHDALDATLGKDKLKEKIVHTPTQGATDELPAEEKQYLQELAIELVATVAEGLPRVAYERLEKEALDDVQKPAIWSMLDSKTRSAIKSAKNIPL